jgi:hypothetical protein
VRMTPVTIAGDGAGTGTTPGTTPGAMLELQSGPSAGTRVVKDPPADLRDGQEIKEKL